MNECEITMCLCWLDECDCQFQRHRKHFTVCESHEIWKLCIKNKPLNHGSWSTEEEGE